MAPDDPHRTMAENTVAVALEVVLTLALPCEHHATNAAAPAVSGTCHLMELRLQPPTVGEPVSVAAQAVDQAF